MEDPSEPSLVPIMSRAEASAIQPGGRARLAGFTIGLLYCTVVVWLSDVAAAVYHTHGYWNADIARGFSIPIVPQFGIGLTAGLLIMLLLIFLFRRTQRNLSIGLLPGAAVLFLLLVGFLISVPRSGFTGPGIGGGPQPLTPQERAALK